MSNLLQLRRLFAVLAVLASLLSTYLTYSGSNMLQFLQAASSALFGATFAVLAFEERAKSKTLPIIFPALSVCMFALSVWVLCHAFANLR